MTFQIVLLIVQLLALLLMGVVGYFVRNTNADIKTLFTLVNEFKLSVANDFLRSNTFENYRAETRETIHGLRNDVNELKVCVSRLKERVKE